MISFGLLLQLAVLSLGVVPGLLPTQGAHPVCKVRGSREWLASRGSPLDSAAIVLGDATAKLCYSRPSARGRVVFGGIVPWGQAWRTGANEPTVLYLTSTAEVAGVRLEAGRYVLLTVPRAERWVIAFYTAQSDDAVEMFRTMSPVGQGTAAAEELEHPVETLTIRGIVEPNRNEFVLEWERVRVRVPVTFIT